MPKLIRGLVNIPADFPACVVTIGNFDGLHLGHQALIRQLLQKSRILNLPATLITFEPQPNEFFAQTNAIPARLTRLREKWLLLQSFPLDYVLFLRFDNNLTELTPEAFIQKILVEKLKVAHILVGDDFCFGHHRSGNFNVLQQQGLQWHFTASQMSTHQLAGQRVSSSRVRTALQAGDLQTAHTLLGRNYSIAGCVSHGQQRGRMIGFPTANIFLHRKAAPISGVYAVKVHGLTVNALYGVANVGTRPTIDISTRVLLEVHLFDFNHSIYGCHVVVEFVKKLRDEKRFESFELLRQQILQDTNEAKAYFNQV